MNDFSESPNAWKGPFRQASVRLSTSTRQTDLSLPGTPPPVELEIPISQLPLAGALFGDEMVAIVQNGITVRSTTALVGAAGGGGGSVDPTPPYVLPTASTTSLGGVIIDGSTITINGSGVISATPQGGPGPGGGASVTISSTPPPSPAVGNLWWDDVGGQMYIWYDDGNTQQWVAVNNPGAGPPGPIASDAPFDSTLYGRVNGSWRNLTYNDIAGLTSQVNLLIAAASIGYSQLPAEVQQVPVPFQFTGQPANSAMLNVPMAMTVDVPAGLAGARVYDNTRATANASFTLNKISAGVSTSLGTVTITPTSNTSANLSGGGVRLVAGDVLQIIAPVAQDATLADVGITLLTTRV